MRWRNVNKATGAVALAALLVGGTVSAGANSSTPTIPPVLSSTSFPYEAFAGYGDLVTQKINEAVQQAVTARMSAHASGGGASAGASASSPQVASVLDQVTKAVAAATPASTPVLPSVNAAAAQAQQQAAAVPAPTAQDVVDLLIGMIDSVDTSVNTSLDQGEAALIAKIEAARTLAHTELTNGGMTQLIPFVDTQLDLAVAMVHQAFATVRTQVNAAFDEMRNRIIQEVTGIDFGDQLNTVVAKLNELKAQVQQELANVTTQLNQALASIGV